jgi:hypothetical protein
MVECSFYQRYKIITDPLIILYSKHFDGYPTIFIGNIKIDGANSRIESETYFRELMMEHFIVPEFSDLQFNKQCEISKKGIFKNKIVCN